MEWKMPRSMLKVEKTERSISVCTPYMYSVPTASIVRFLCMPYGVKTQGYDFGGRASRSRPSAYPLCPHCVHAPSKLRTKTLAYRSSESKSHFHG